jgi:hypothetical protein
MERSRYAKLLKTNKFSVLVVLVCEQFLLPSCAFHTNIKAFYNATSQLIPC